MSEVKENEVIDLATLKEKEPELFAELVAKYPVKTDVDIFEVI